MHELERRRRVPRRQRSHMKSSEIVESLKDKCLPACAQAIMFWSRPSSQAARHCSQVMPSAIKYASCNLRLPSWSQVAVRGGRISGLWLLLSYRAPGHRSSWSWASIVMELARPVPMTDRYIQMHLNWAPGHQSRMRLPRKALPQWLQCRHHPRRCVHSSACEVVHLGGTDQHSACAWKI